jgi:hypothetical protein
MQQAGSTHIKHGEATTRRGCSEGTAEVSFSASGKPKDQYIEHIEDPVPLSHFKDQAAVKTALRGEIQFLNDSADWKICFFKRYFRRLSARRVHS